MIDCRYWTSCGVTGGGCCKIHRYGGMPSLGVCGYCIAQGQNKAAGLGDTISHWIMSIIEEMSRTRSRYHLGRVVRRWSSCGGCNGRGAWINQVVPYA